MADLFLHLPFARRLRFAEGLHPLAGEAIGRRPDLVVLGASLAGLPARERQGMSWFRRLFSGGGEAARWQKLLAPTPGQPHVELLLAVLRSEDAPVGPMARFALGAGMLAHEILEEKIGALTSSMAGPQRAAVERAQARLWLQMLEFKGSTKLDNEWSPGLDLADSEAHKRPLQHLDRALKRVHGTGPGEGALARWLKALAAEMGPLADANARPRGQEGASLPPSLSIADSDARAAHFDQVGFLDKTKAATTLFVTYANRLAEAFQKGSPEHAALVDALGKLDDVKADVGASRLRWKSWIDETREATMTRGRNPKPAFAEGEYQAPSTDHRLASITKVMSLADLPPESGDSGAPPMPEGSGPVARPPPMPEGATATQEVSLAQIEADFESPPMTQEVSIAQIEAEGFAAPAHTQEVSAAQVVDGAPPANVTQPISMADVVAANEEDLRAIATTQVEPSAPAVTPPPEPMTEPPGIVDDGVSSPPRTVPPEDVVELPIARSAEDAVAAMPTNGADASNGVGHGSTGTPADSQAEPGAPTKAHIETEPPRE